VRATRTKIPWPQVPFKRASVNSFGYGGSNAHVIVEEPSCLLPGWSSSHLSSYQADADLFGDDDDETAGKPFLLVLSANDESSLRAHVKALKNHLTNPNVKVPLLDLSHTLAERRTQHFHRGYLVTQTAAVDETSLVVGKKASNEPRVGFIFTGQGAQWPQMGKAIVDTFPRAREILDHLDSVLQASVVAPSWSLLRTLPRGIKREMPLTCCMRRRRTHGAPRPGAATPARVLPATGDGPPNRLG
jgi:acyl transferase domain-containing protein